MSEKKDDGGPAFPTLGSAHEIPGVSLRDWFAGMTLSGLASDPEFYNLSYEMTAKIVYKQADAMIEARKR
jgi:hypothetical protein